MLLRLLHRFFQQPAADIVFNAAACFLFFRLRRNGNRRVSCGRFNLCGGFGLCCLLGGFALRQLVLFLLPCGLQLARLQLDIVLADIGAHY